MHSPTDTQTSPADFARNVRTIILGEGKTLVRLLLASLLSAGLALALPHASRIALDSALPDASPRLLIVVALTVIVLIAHQAWLSWISSIASLCLSALAERKAMTHVMRGLLSCELPELQKRDGGWMTTTLMGASSVASAYVGSCSTTLLQSLTAIAYFVSLAQTSPTAAFLISGFNLAIAGTSYVVARFQSGSVKVALEKDGTQRELLHLLLNALPALRGHFASKSLAGLWQDSVSDAAKESYRIAQLGVAVGVLQSAGSRILSVGFAIWGASECFAGEITIGELAFLTSVATGLSGALTSLVQVATGLRVLRPQLSRINELLDSRPAFSEPQREAPMASGDAIVVEGVSFQYPGSATYAVQNKSLRIAQGECRRLEGASGTGKSTTLRLIAGLTRPSKGTIRVLGMDAPQAKEHVLYLPQHCKLFEASLRENLELLSGASLAHIAEVSQLTGLSDIIASLPMGLETHIAAQGQNLSSGQRQLVALTAAFASSRSVLLLDEATSQVDALSRNRIQWDALSQGRTVVVVEHG